MKKILLLSGVLLAFSASMALAAGGLNLAWGPSCWADNPAASKTWTCATNGATLATFTGSFTVGSDIPDFVGISAVIDLQANSATLPAWWDFFNPGSCRPTSLSVGADFTTTTTSCNDVFAGQAGGGIT